MCLWSLIIVESEHTLTCAKCTSSGVRWIICGCGMWFLLSNVVCNGIPCYLESGSASEACEHGDRRTQCWRYWAWVLGLWAQIQPLAHIIHGFSTANNSESYCDCMSFCSGGVTEAKGLLQIYMSSLRARKSSHYVGKQIQYSAINISFVRVCIA